MHELVEPLRSNLLTKGRDVEWQSLVLLSSCCVGSEGFRQLCLGNVPEVRLIVFFKLLLPLQKSLTERDPNHNQLILFRAVAINDHLLPFRTLLTGSS